MGEVGEVGTVEEAAGEVSPETEKLPTQTAL